MPDMKSTTPVRSITQAMRHVRRGEAVHAEGVGGVLIVQRETAFGRWQCTFGRFGITEAIRLLTRTADVHDWLRQFFPRLMGRDPRGDHRRSAGGRVSYEGRRRLSAPAARTRGRRR
jgi:hypothetical protein